MKKTTGSEPLSPDWVITGAPHGGGVRVIASKNMRPGSSLSIIERTSVRTVNRKPVAFYQHDHWKITVLAEDVVIVDADDYGTALRILMGNWSVEDAPEPVREIFTSRLTPSQPGLYASMDAMVALEEATKPMSDAERALIEGVLDEEP